ncbi:MAG: hypothetical protein CEE43_11325 [Promethearchaeota archaeon Loki_b32]|nr:MAG: hypothetical protein CEE43_11325 [Candidatus Lokiarchaeota archaeon Loki_b32]
MTIYELSIISTTGFPYFNTLIKPIPEGVKIFLRFFDFSKEMSIVQDQLDMNSKFDLTAGLISALFEFARNIDKKIEVLEFKPKKEKEIHKDFKKKGKYQGDVLITTQTESFLLHKSVREKTKLIYTNFINSKIPLDSAEVIYENEENKIIDILTDSKARKKISKHRNDIKRIANDFLSEMKDYGLWGICITSFDLSPLVTFGRKYSLENVYEILRHIGYIPEIVPLEWIYRQSFFSDEQIQVCIVKSNVGPTIENILFEPYFYLLFADPQSYFGEFPAKLTSSFSTILG